MVGVSDGLSVGRPMIDMHEPALDAVATEPLVSLVALRGGSEIHATGGDIRRICDLFGLSFERATLPQERRAPRPDNAR
jgi:enoyl-CoA hydratase/carnithine racemase